MSDLLRTEFSMVMRIKDGETYRQLPVLAFSQTFAANEIPIATCELGLGINVSDADLPQAIDSKTRDLLAKDVPVQILSVIRGDLIPGTAWPEDATVLFEGRIYSVKQIKIRGRSTLEVWVHHWLADLQSSQLLGAYVDPLNDKFNVAAQELYFDNAAQAGDSPLNSTLRSIVGAQFLEDQGVPLNDVWGEGIKRSFLEILKAGEKLSEQQSLNNCFDLLNLPKPEAIEALKRIQGPAEFGTPYDTKYTGPLGIQLDGVDTAIQTALTNFITAIPVTSLFSVDVWSLLVQHYLPALMLQIVPFVNSAAIVPVTKSLRSPYCRNIVADDILQIEAMEPIYRPVRAVVVAVPQELDANDGLDNVGVCYVSSDVNKYGATIMLQPPQWLASIGAYVDNGQAVMGVVERTTRSGAYNPELPPNTQVVSKDDPVETQDAITKLFQNYAREQYNLLRLQGKSLKVATRLRFDISPGSIVKVSAKADQVSGLGASDLNTLFRPSVEIYGCVTRVTNTINAPSRSAGTMYEIDYVRTAEENDNSDFTVDSPVLYNLAFTGAPLVDTYAVPPCP